MFVDMLVAANDHLRFTGPGGDKDTFRMSDSVNSLPYFVMMTDDVVGRIRCSVDPMLQTARDIHRDLTEHPYKFIGRIAPVPELRDFELVSCWRGRSLNCRNRSIDRLIDGPTDWLIDWWIDWLMDPSIDWLIDWSIDWLVGWLVGWLVEGLGLSQCINPGVLFFNQNVLRITHSFCFAHVCFRKTCRSNWHGEREAICAGK